jgi:hypothetical protein
MDDANCRRHRVGVDFVLRELGRREEAAMHLVDSLEAKAAEALHEANSLLKKIIQVWPPA